MVDLSAFNRSYPIEVRFGDLDALGHVNNATFLTYIEQARIRYFVEVTGWQGDITSIGLILARAECDFRAPIHYPETVTVHIRTARLGGKSFDLAYALTTSDGTLVAEAKTVIVCYDYEQDITIPIPDDWRASLSAADA